MTREQLRAWVARSRAKQGLPPAITDPATLAQFAVLVVHARRAAVAAAPAEREEAYADAS